MNRTPRVFFTASCYLPFTLFCFILTRPFPLKASQSRMQEQPSQIEADAEQSRQLRAELRANMRLTNQAALISELQQLFHYGCDHFVLVKGGEPPKRVFLRDLNTYFSTTVEGSIAKAVSRTAKRKRAVDIVTSELARFIKANKKQVLKRTIGVGPPARKTIGTAVLTACPCGIQMHKSCFEACRENHLDACPNSFCPYQDLWKTECIYSWKGAEGELQREAIHPQGECAICLERLESLQEEKTGHREAETKESMRKRFFWDTLCSTCSPTRIYFNGHRVI